MNLPCVRKETCGEVCRLNEVKMEFTSVGDCILIGGAILVVTTDYDVNILVTV